MRAGLADLPPGDAEAEAAVAARQARLTKPQGSLGRLEELVGWLGRWQGRATPRLDHVEVLVFAGNHGVVAQGVSAYPASVTAQMVANFERGGAAINQLCANVGARLRVIPLALETPTADFTAEPAMSEAEFAEAIATGFGAVPPNADLICLGEMGIGNTTAAAALAASPVRRRRRALGRARHGRRRSWARAQARGDRFGARAPPAQSSPTRYSRPWPLAAASLPPSSAPRWPRGGTAFPCCSTASPRRRRRRPSPSFAGDALDHARIAHCSAEAGHRMLCAELGMRPILDLDMRLGEASGAALAVAVLRAALACHLGMATFDEAGVDERS